MKKKNINIMSGLEAKMKTKEQIQKRLKELEKKYNITILFAVESGSRGWKFASEDSDYDIRGTYMYNDKTIYYRALEEEQIELIEEDLDISLWDVRKFWRLLRSSNPSISEWLKEDIVYVNKLDIISSINKEFDKKLDEISLIKHYYSMATQNYFKYIKGNSMVSYKKYLYILRGIGCAEYIKKNHKRPPLDYKELEDMFPKKIWKKFDKIVSMKKNNEKYEAKSDKELDDFIVIKLMSEGIKIK